MRFSPATAALGVAVVTASVLMLAAPATAATPGVTFVTAADIVDPATFTTVGWGNTQTGAISSSLNGLSAANDTELFYGFASPVSTVGGVALRALGDDTSFYVSDDTDIYAEISLFTDVAHTAVEILFAQSNGTDFFTDGSLLWLSTTAIGSIAAFTPATLAAFDAELATDAAFADTTVAGAGLYNDGSTIDVYRFIVDGADFYFTPEPAPTAPTSIGQVDFGTAGITATTTGFVPGEIVTAYLATTQSLSDPIDLVADVNGAVSYTWIAPVTSMDLGTYAISFIGAVSVTTQVFEFDVLAQTALAATGVDASVPILAAGTLLLGGVALTVAGRRNRQHSHA